MSRQLFPVLESTGGGGSEGKGNARLGAFGRLSLTLAINFGIINETFSARIITGNSLLLSDLSLPTMKVGAKEKSYIGANELT